MVPFNPTWKEFDVSNLYRDTELKHFLDNNTIIIRQDLLECVYLVKAKSDSTIIGNSDGIWTIEGFPVKLYGRLKDVERLYQDIRRTLLGIVACEDLKVDGNFIAKMI